MNGNLGKTSLKKRVFGGSQMEEFDRLPAQLRRWLSNADLPWSPASVRRVYRKSLDDTNDARKALDELDNMQRKRLRQQKYSGIDRIIK